jgi:hypothetical protein
MKVKTWEILDKDFVPNNEGVDGLPLDCPNCDNEAYLATNGSPGALIIAAYGLNLVMDPPGVKPREGFLPNEIRCRKCRCIFSRGEE